MKKSTPSLNSTFNWYDNNLRALLRNIRFSVYKYNDISYPFCHFSHKNLGTQLAPFRKQSFRLYLDDLVNVKYISIDNYTHGSYMTISLATHPNAPFTEVYKDQYICKGKTLKQQSKLVDIGALPCRVIYISVTKGCKISTKNISIVGMDSSEIQQRLGEEYFRLLVLNPMKILYAN